MPATPNAGGRDGQKDGAVSMIPDARSTGDVSAGIDDAPPLSPGTMAGDAAPTAVDASEITAADGQATPDARVTPDLQAPVDVPTTTDIAADSPISPDAQVMIAPDVAIIPPCAPTPDEDGDGVGDLCDNCPADFNPGQANAGELSLGRAMDSLGDVCDPRPMDTGDGLLFFDGFNSAALDSGWLGDRAVFSVVAGALTIDRANDTNRYALRRGTGRNVMVVAHFSITKFIATVDNRNFWLGVRGDVASDDAYRCSARKDTADITTLAFFTWANITSPAATTPATFGIGPTYRLSAKAFGTDLTCTLGPSVFAQKNIMDRDGFVEVKVRHTSVNVHDVVVYRLGP
jgi:hypothetical protein